MYYYYISLYYTYILYSITSAMRQITDFPITHVKELKLQENKQLILSNKIGFYVYRI